MRHTYWFWCLLPGAVVGCPAPKRQQWGPPKQTAESTTYTILHQHRAATRLAVVEWNEWWSTVSYAIFYKITETATATLPAPEATGDGNETTWKEAVSGPMSGGWGWGVVDLDQGCWLECWLANKRKWASGSGFTSATLTSLPSHSEAKQLHLKIRALLSSGLLEIRPWVSNFLSVVDHLPPAGGSDSAELWLNQNRTDPVEGTLLLSFHCVTLIPWDIDFTCFLSNPNNEKYVQSIGYTVWPIRLHHSIYHKSQSLSPTAVGKQQAMGSAYNHWWSAASRPQSPLKPSWYLPKYSIQKEFVLCNCKYLGLEISWFLPAPPCSPPKFGFTRN